MPDCGTGTHDRTIFSSRATRPSSILSKSADIPFYGKFWGGLEDDDGFLAWDEPILFEVKQSVERRDDFERHNVLVEPRKVPLEVGYTEGSRSWVHLVSEGALARWPYGSESITFSSFSTAKIMAEGDSSET